MQTKLRSLRLPRTSNFFIGLMLLIPLVGASTPGHAAIVFLGLGDSVTFGFDPSAPDNLTPSLGDKGFVKPLADYLAGQNGGVRPEVRNLAIPGELMSSFFSGQAPADWPNRAPQLNLNYSGTNVS